MALDFAVTSGMRDIRASAQDASASVTAYEDFKRTHLDTETLCTAEGFGFTPMVVEARGGAWGAAASKIFSELAKTKSIITGEPEDMVLSHLYQSLGVILHRENAKALLKRMSMHTGHEQSVLNAASELQSSAAAAAVDLSL